MGDLSWGEMVRTLRALLGWSQEELAQRSEVYRTVCARQEEEVSPPNLQARQKIERALGLEGVLEQVRGYLAELKERIERGGDRGADWSLEAVEERGARLFASAMRVGLEILRGETADREGVSWGVFSATLRSLRGWSQGDLGKETAISVKALSRLESGLAQVSEANQERIELALLGESGLAARVVRMELGGLRAMLRSPKYPPVEKQIEEGREVGRQLLRSALEVGLARVESHWESEEGEDDPEGLRESLLWF